MAATYRGATGRIEEERAGDVLCATLKRALTETVRILEAKRKKLPSSKPYSCGL